MARSGDAGYRLRLNTIRNPSGRRPIRIKWYAIGQFRYFDPRRWAPTLVGLPQPARADDYIDDYIEDLR